MTTHSDSLPHGPMVSCACPMVDGAHLSTCSAAWAMRQRRLVMHFEGTVEELRDWLVQLADHLETRRWEMTATLVDPR